MATALQGFGLLATYSAMVFLVAWAFARGEQTKESFLVANRNVGEWRAAFSIASAWIWAPALFVSAQKAYENGWVGLFWFLVPNALCLVIFSYFAKLMREKAPNGFTLSEYMLTRYSKRVHNAYLFQQIGLLACCLAVQLLAGGKIVATITGIPFFWVTVILAAIAVSYSILFGLRASVVTDFFKMLFIFVIGATLIPWALKMSGGLEVLKAGLYGKTGTFTSLFSGDGAALFWSFGLSTTIGLIAGPFGDQAFWQRGFAVRKEKVAGAFIKGALIFSLVPLMMSALGFIAAGANLEVKDPSIVNVEAILHLLPAWAVIPFILMIISGLVSALDSHLTAISSIGGHDLSKRAGKEGRSLSFARTSMIFLMVAAIWIANIPGIQVLYLFMLYGTLRSSTLLPTVMTLLSDRLTEKGIFWGIVSSIAIGLPIFAYGNYHQITPMIVSGSLITLFTSGAVAWLMRRKAV